MSASLGWLTPPAPRRNGLLCALGLLSVVSLYVAMAPHTVQGLDAGELVAGAYNRTVVHPPGYPLWVWLMHAATHSLCVGSIFFRAAIATIAAAALVLLALGLVGSLRPLTCLIFVLPLALQQTFYTYALVPDVFMLHGLLSVLLWLIYERVTPGTARSMALGAVFGLGLANHQTLVFAAPLVLQGIWADKRHLQALGALCLGLSMCTLLYASLVLMHPCDARAWGDLQTATDFLNHVLRREYGTWRLARTGGPVSLFVHWRRWLELGLDAMPLNIIFGCLAPGLMLARASWRRLVPQRLRWIYASLNLYMVLFFSGANQTDSRVLERFFLMPAIGYTYVAVALYERLQLGKKPRLQLVLCAFALFFCGIHVAKNRALRSLHSNTIVEDYAQNLLRMAERQPPTVLIVDGDAPLGALRYVQHVQQVSADVAVIPHTGPAGWQLTRLHAANPNFWVPQETKRGLHTSELMSQLIEPNEPKFSFLCTTTRGLDISNQQVTYLGLGRRLQMGSGRSVDTASIGDIVLRSTPVESHCFSKLREDKVLFSMYATASFVAGKISSDREEKKAHFQRALARVPFCWPAAYQLCLLRYANDKAACTDLLPTNAAHDATYF